MTEIKRSLAVVIGINGYINGIPPLKTAVNDATKLAINLKENYQYTVYQLLDTQATYLTLTQLFVAFQSQTIPLLDGSTISVQPDDRLLFYFAGHGIAVDGIDNADGPAGFLVPQDAQLESQTSWIPMQQLHDALIALPCRHLLIVLDCCFAGSFRWAGHSRHAVRSQKVYRERYDRFVSGFAQQVITSAAHDEKAADSLYRFGQRQEGEMHSPFAELLLKALSGAADFTTDGVMTATELYLYLHSELGKTVAKQTPGICQMKRHDKGEFIFPVPGFDRSLLTEAPKLDENTNPYRGLESFDEQHSKLFFGRKVLVEKLLNVVVEHALTVVMGASGSGKSSLVKAGLVPQLRNSVGAYPVGRPSLKVHPVDRPPTIPTPWRILAPIRPGEAPFIALNKMLSLENFPIVDFSNQISQDKNEGYEQQIKSLSQAVATWSQENPQTKLLIVIDQCEELVTLCQADEEKNQFLNLLASAIAAFPDQLRIILTLRSDFEPQFRDTALEPYWTAARFVVPAMRRDELRQVIEEPATTRVMYFEPPGLVNQLIDEVAQMPGALPLLSFSLSELYLKYIRSCQEGKRNDRAITQEDYEEIGGVTRSLTQRADCEYDELVKQNPTYTKTVRNVMLRMVAVSGGELARRQVLLSELEYPEPENGRVKEVIRCFSIARLVVGGQDTEGNLYVEPAHDVLVRGWQKLLSWKKQEQETLILQRRLTPAAQEWKSKQHQQYLWHNDPRLPLLKQVLRSPECWLNSLESEFVQRSIQRRRSNRLRIMSVAVGGVTVLFGALLDASGQRDIAQRQSITAFSNSSEAFYTSNQQLKALVNAVQAGIHFKTLNLGKTDQLYPIVMSALQQTVYGVRERNSLRGHGEGVLSVSFSPDGQLIATGSDDNTVKLWNREGKERSTFKGHQGAVNSVSFSPDGQTLATASADKTVKLWSLDGKRVQTLAGHSNVVTSISFSPDGKTIASTSWDKTVKLWNQDGKELLTLQGHDRGVDSVSFSPDGQTIATASWDKTVKLWNLEGQEQLILQGHQARVGSVSFSPDGQLIATASYDKTVKLWNRQGQELQTLQGHNSGVSSISFSPDGQTIASASVDKTVKLWNRDGQELQTLRGHNSGVSSISFSPDGQTIASASWDKTVKLWNWNQKDQPTLRGHQEQVWSVSFSPDDQLIATASDDNTVKLWSRGGKELQTLQGHNFGVTSVSFSPDSQLIATASDDNTVKLWSRDGKDLHTLRGHTFGIATASDDNSIKLWNQEGKKLHILRGHRVGNSFGLLSVGVNSVSFSSDGQLIGTGGNDKTVKLWSREGKELYTLRGHKNEVTSVSFSPDGQTIASASIDKTVKLWNPEGKLLQTLQGHQSRVYSVSFSPDSQLIATGSNDNTIKLWSREGKELQTLTKHTAGVNSVSFSPDSQLIASASADNTVKLWSREGKELLTLRGHGDKVLSLSFSPDGQTIASTSLNNTVMLWNLKDLELDKLLTHGCHSLHHYLNNPTADLSQDERHICKDYQF